jgi:hypothetical protein
MGESDKEMKQGDKNTGTDIRRQIKVNRDTKIL